MKRNFLLVPIFLMTACLSGCSPQLTTETITHEAGEELSTDVTEYATFKKPEKAAEATLDLSNVVADKVGTYEATITLKNKEYPFTVEVVDTTAPDGIINQFVVTCGIDERITPEKFEGELTDLSSVELGIRNPVLLKEEEQLAELIKGNLQEADEAGSEYVTYQDMIDYEFNEKTDSWDETGVLVEDLESEFVPDKTGLYKLEYCAVDEHGNADITYVYVIADLKAPVLKAEDIEVKVTSDFEKYMKSLNDGLSAEDNLMGDLTSTITVTDTVLDDSSSANLKMTTSYEVVDMAGNITEGSRSIKAKANTVPVTNNTTNGGGTGTTENHANGHDRSRAEQAFAAVNQQRAAAGLNELAWDESIYQIAAQRAEEVVSNYSHTRSSTGRTTVEDYNLGENLNKLWGDTSANAAVQSWMNSNTHKSNLLTGYYTRTAVACYQSGKYCYYVQLFGF